MAAFDRISCGVEGLDKVFDNIRLGDNVVWQLSSLDLFPAFVAPLVRQCVKDGRPLIYIRFASHEPLVEAQEGVTVYELDPHKGFELFAMDVREIATKQGQGVCYVFDCLSELQAAWSADLMMGNFFQMTCPYLFELNTVAYFPFIRGMHSYETIAKIRETTQLFVDVYPDGEDLYVHPLKVWKRYTETMFLAHRFTPSSGAVAALTDGFEATRFYVIANEEANAAPDRDTDSWDRFFNEAQERFKAGTLQDSDCDKMCDMMMTWDARMHELVRTYFSPEDYFEVRNHMVGTGVIGGKACGMLVARKIVEHELPQYAKLLEPHDSHYIGADVFYSYIVENGLWKLRFLQHSEEGFVKWGPELREGILNGSFDDNTRARLMQMLESYGQTPIIVRSSSVLEDGFGSAFAGKYESIFVANMGSDEERLEALEDAIRRVYASTMDPSAVEYRRRNGLYRREEQMAILVQRVSGSTYTSHVFTPTAAGVGYSKSTYRWSENMDPEAGMLRIVAGLGTRAVDRTQNDYPRIVSLDRPEARPYQSWADRHYYSQHYVDVLDLEKRSLVARDALELADVFPSYANHAVFEHDQEAEARLRERGRRQKVLFASCQGLAENHAFITMMTELLATLERCYGSPVDIEYTVNVGGGEQFVVNLLQCRPLLVLTAGSGIELPDLPREDVFFRVEKNAMGRSRREKIDAVVYVDPVAYYRCPQTEKPTVAYDVGRANAYLRRAGSTCLLLVPGRIGTSSPELGVPVSFAEISDFSGICEMAYSAAGYNPELSYGSHLFQDLVEADIYYGALLEDAKKAYLDVGFLKRFRDVTEEGMGSGGMGIVRIYDTRGTGLTLWHDLASGRSVCGIDEDAAEDVGTW